MITFRRSVPEDRERIERWIELDERHNGMPADFWLQTIEGAVSCYMVEDENGPIIAVRQEVTTEETTTLHLQFANCGRKKIVRALAEGYPLVAEDARQRGFKRIFFRSLSPALVRTMMGMGFRAELIAEL
jgi:hypothetical protein